MNCHPINPYPESKHTVPQSNIKCMIINVWQKNSVGKLDILSISSYGVTYKPLFDSLLQMVDFEGQFKLMISLNENMEGS
jgi:hypothetical protein